MKPNHPSFFIFGPERSGTTLLTFLLSGQPDVFVLNDSFIFDQFIEWSLVGAVNNGSRRARLARLARGLMPFVKPKSIRDLTSQRRLYYSARASFALRIAPDTVISYTEVEEYYRVLRARYLSSLGNNRASFLNGYVSGIPDPMPYANLPDLFTNTLASISRLFVTSPFQVLGEKSPLHTPYADWIRNLYPDAKTILVVRRPVANVASIYRRYGDFRRALLAYDMYAAKLMKMNEEPHVLVVRHEDVTQTTSSTLRRVLGFLDPSLRFDESCPINAYTKTAYTGKEIDQNRDGTTASTLKEHQVELVKRRFHRITERFYGD